MNRKLVIFLLGIFLTFSTVSAQISPDLENKFENNPGVEKVEVIMLTQPNANEKAKNAVKNAKGNVSHNFDIIDGVAVEIPKQTAENLAQKDFVREIQPDYTVETRISESTQTVNADQVWSNSTGEGVDVAVLDTGIEDNTILNVEDQVDYTGEGTDDLNGHGTHVAGIVASPDEEYTGVAYGADLFDVKVLDQEGSGTASDVISGLEWAVENNAEVATLSLGAEVSECDGTSSISEAVDNAVNNGVAVTVAAGNNGPDSKTITAPGCAEKPITVGSSGNGEISDFSSRGPTADGRNKPDLVAPGESITSLWKNNGDSPQFQTLSGTSMATPHVAGAAALLLAEEDLSPSEVKNITKYSAEDMGFDENSQGSGRLDAYAAYQHVADTENKTENKTDNQPPVVEALETQVSLLNSSAEAQFRINGTDEDNESIEISFYLDGEEVEQYEGYGEITHTEDNLSLNTTYSWYAEVTDGLNTSSTEEQEFNTEKKKEEDQEENKTENRTRKELPEEASDRAREARRNKGGGFFGPRSAFYGLDIAFDRASVAIGLRSKQDVMKERANEATEAAEQGDTRAAEKAVDQLRESAGDDENATKEAEDAINRVIKDAPEQAQKGLQNALENVKKQRDGKEERKQKNQENVEKNQSKGNSPENRKEQQKPGQEQAKDNSGREKSESNGSKGQKPEDEEEGSSKQKNLDQNQESKSAGKDKEEKQDKTSQNQNSDNPKGEKGTNTDSESPDNSENDEKSPNQDTEGNNPGNPGYSPGSSVDTEEGDENEESSSGRENGNSNSRGPNR